MPQKHFKVSQVERVEPPTTAGLRTRWTNRAATTVAYQNPTIFLEAQGHGQGPMFRYASLISIVSSSARADLVPSSPWFRL